MNIQKLRCVFIHSSFDFIFYEEEKYCITNSNKELINTRTWHKTSQKLEGQKNLSESRIRLTCNEKVLGWLSCPREGMTLRVG